MRGTGSPRSALRPRRGAIGFLFLLLGLSVFCLAPGASAAPPNDVLTVALDTNPLNLDPRLTTDATAYRIGQLLFNRLVVLDARGEPTPDLAERWESPDPLTHTFYLRRGVRFHHGPELTAVDVKATFDRVLDPRFKSPHASGLDKVARIEAPDPSRVVVRLKEPFAPLYGNLGLGIVPRDRADDPDFARRPVGSGPFRFVRFAPNDHLEVEAFAAYFEGSPRLGRIRFRIIPDATVRFLELKKGTLDFLLNGITPEALPTAQALPGVRTLEIPSNSYTYLGFNLRDPILRDRRVREALAHAIDRRAIIEALLTGRASPAHGFFRPGHWAHVPDLSPYAYDPARARRILDQAGYPVRADGARFTLTYKTTTTELLRAIGEAYQEQLAQVGIRLDIRSYEWGTLYSDIRMGNFQLYALTWVGVRDPDIFHYVFHSRSVPPHGANRGWYRNPEVDRLIDEGRVTLDRGARRAVYARIQQILAEDLPYLSLWHSKHVAVLRDRVQGFELTPTGDFTSFKQVWVKR